MPIRHIDILLWRGLPPFGFLRWTSSVDINHGWSRGHVLPPRDFCECLLSKMKPCWQQAWWRHLRIYHSCSHSEYDSKGSRWSAHGCKAHTQVCYYQCDWQSWTASFLEDPLCWRSRLWADVNANGKANRISCKVGSTSSWQVRLTRQSGRHVT